MSENEGLLHETCKICIVNSGNFTVPQCNHAFCTDCIKLYLSIKITEGDVVKISCPEPDCQTLITPEVIESLLPELMAKFLNFIEKKRKELNPNFRWCPNKECSGFDEKSISDKLICNQCQAAFCYLCAKPWHEGLCAGNPDSLLKNLKRCPQCSVVIEKNHGCHELSCSVCGFRFCWLCGQGMNAHNIRKCILLSKDDKFYWIFAAFLMLFPVVLVFFVPAALGFMIYFDDGYDKFKRNKVKFLCGFFFGTLLSPGLFPIALIYLVAFQGPGYFIVKLMRKISNKVAKVGFVLGGIPFLYVFLVIGIASVVIVMNVVVPFVGCVIFSYKLFLLCC